MTSLVIFSMIFGISCLTFWITSDFESAFSDKKYANKEQLKATIATIVRNNGELKNIKHVFDSRLLVSKPFYKKRSEYEKDYYEDDITLSFVLNDILIDAYKNEKNNLGYTNRLKLLTQENDQINPFGQLDDMQKYYFDNIRCKLDSSYTTIQPDVNKVTEELNSKNQLVNKYLNKSELSFTISIIALAVTLIISAYQIFQSHKSNKTMKRMFLEASKIRVGDSLPINTYHKTRDDGSQTYVIYTEMEAIKQGLEERGYTLHVSDNKRLYDVYED